MNPEILRITHVMKIMFLYYLACYFHTEQHVYASSGHHEYIDTTYRTHHIPHIGYTNQVLYIGQIRSHISDGSYTSYRTDQIAHIGQIRFYTSGGSEPVHQTDQIPHMGHIRYLVPHIGQISSHTSDT